MKTNCMVYFLCLLSLFALIRPSQASDLDKISSVSCAPDNAPCLKEQTNTATEYFRLEKQKLISKYETQVARAKFNHEVYEHNILVYRFQYWSSIFLLFVVSLLVIGGFYLSWLQFTYETRNGRQGDKNELEITKSGIKISSSVIGLIILFLSLGFFYLYMDNVYPVRGNKTAEPIKDMQPAEKAKE